MNKEMNMDQHTLVDAWQKQLPEYLNPGDSAQVQADGANPQGLRIHINAAGHQFFPLIFNALIWTRARFALSWSMWSGTGRP